MLGYYTSCSKTLLAIACSSNTYPENWLQTKHIIVLCSISVIEVISFSLHFVYTTTKFDAITK
jgi:hypothetical protein